MSQTETVLLILVGFSLAALIFLFLARGLWQAGARIGARRMRQKLPSNVAELQSERDSLRGEYARLSQKLGARLEQTKLQMAEQMAEVSRHRNRLVGLAEDLNSRDDEIEHLRLRVAALEEDMKDAEVRLAESAELLRAAHAEMARADHECDELRRKLTTHVPSPANAAPPDVPPASGEAPPDDHLERRAEEFAARQETLATEGGEVRNLSLAAPADPLVLENLEKVNGETADLQAELERLDAVWKEKLGDGATAQVVNLAQRLKATRKPVSR